MASSAFVAVGRVLTLQAQETGSLRWVKDEFDRIVETLRSLQRFLVDIDARADEAAIRSLVEEIREVAYDAEDVTETCVLETSFKRSVCFMDERWKIQKIKSKLTKITNKITVLTRKWKEAGVEQATTEEHLSSTKDKRQKITRYYQNIVGGSIIVGLDGDIKKIVSLLVGDTTDFQVISICGMGGLGKTTLAKKVYNHHLVRDNFVGHAWVHVSLQCRARKIWEDILYGLGFLNAKGSKKSDEVLASKLHKFLKENKCLIVLDDIWSLEDWNTIEAAFPSKSETGCKILLTTRNMTILPYADPEGCKYKLKFLSDEDSWELFQRIAFSGGDFIDASRMEISRDIVRRCRGLPLAVVLMGGILATKSSVCEWEMMGEMVRGMASGMDGFLPMAKLAYDDLPYDLKLCFLYFSQFPKDYEINVVKLVQLWVTEGLVPSTQLDDEWESIEDIAESYLMELVERCMIQVGEREANLKIKTCYMHDLMRDLCLSVAGKENFMGIFSKPMNVRVERLAIHEYIPIKYFKNPNLRSLLFFNEIYPDEMISSPLRETAEIYLREDKQWISMLWQLFKFMRKFRRILSYIFNNFKLLRVLDFEGAEIYMEGEFLRDIGKLTRLRHLSLKSTTCVSKIPSSLGKLKWLQTLDLRMNEEFPVQIPDVIWKMEMLIHLYLPVVCDSKTKLRLNTLRNLRTLVNFNSKNCYVDDLRSMTNLRELRIIRYFYIDDFEVNSAPVIIASEHLRSLSISRPERIDLTHSQYLVSTCVHISDLSLAVSIGEFLPASDKFSDQITFMSLSETELSSDPMPTLEKLPNLRVLELHKAFIGEELHCSTLGFPELGSLKLIANSNLDNWIVDEQPCMPKLRHLEIIDCKSLKMLPVGLKYITTLEELKIELMPKAFKDNESNKIKHVPLVIFQNCY